MRKNNSVSQKRSSRRTLAQGAPFGVVAAMHETISRGESFSHNQLEKMGLRPRDIRQYDRLCATELGM